MKIIFILSTGNYKKGDILELPEKKTAQFIGAGFAKMHTEKPVKKTRKPRTPKVK